MQDDVGVEAVTVTCSFCGLHGSAGEVAGHWCPGRAVFVMEHSTDDPKGVDSMSLHITDNAISSDVTEETALFDQDAAADGNGAWLLSWMPGRLFTRNQAISGMQAQEYRATGRADAPEVAQWEAELDLGRDG